MDQNTPTLDIITNLLEFILFEARHLLWGALLISLIGATGTYLTLFLGDLQFRYLLHSFSRKHGSNTSVSSNDKGAWQGAANARQIILHTKFNCCCSSYKVVIHETTLYEQLLISQKLFNLPPP